MAQTKVLCHQRFSKVSVTPQQLSADISEIELALVTVLNSFGIKIETGCEK